MLLSAVVMFSGCRKIFDLPEEKDYMSNNINYSRTTFDPILGRTTLYSGIFNADNSSFPMTFEIVNPHFGDGRSADHILAKRPVEVWVKEYTGLETSLEEIEAKRKIEERSLVEVRSSGELIVWNAATRDLIEPRDSVVYPQDIHYFDVKVKNSGGTKIIKDLSFTPWIERPYWPDEDINPYTGGPNTMSTTNLTLRYNYPSLFGMYGESTNLPMDNPRDASRGEVHTYIRKFEGGNGHSLRFKFLDKDSLPIDPARFNETRWDLLIHGFNRQMTEEYVQYDVAYPIPLARLGTRFTSGGIEGSGENAFVEFVYSRKGFGGTRAVGGLRQEFRIYEKGDWEIVFHFKTVNPKFQDE
jgi:hypothetical protein